MTDFSKFVLPGAKVVRAYAESLLKNVKPEIFARKPVVGGTLVETNHPAFIYGHLALYPQIAADFLEVAHPAIRTPDGFLEHFKNGSPCHDDPAGTIYPEMGAVVAPYFEGTDALLELLPTVPYSRFETEMPDPKRRERWPTIGAFVAYLLAAHPNGHLGQVSTWRRCMGLGPA